MSPRAGLNAQRITEVAADLADEIGFDNVTLSAVARTCGVRDPSLYVHVRNLQDLRVRVGLLASAELNDRIGTAVAGHLGSAVADGHGRAALIGFAEAYRGFVLDHPGRYAATQIRMDPDEVGDAPALRRSVELTTALLQAYGLADPDLTDAGRLLRSTFHGFATLEGAGGFAHPRSTDTSWRSILDALHRTLSQWPSSAARDQKGHPR